MVAETAYRILVLGGYGQFGSRIVRTLAAESNCHIVVAGRHPRQANLLIEQILDAIPASSLSSAAIDVASPQLIQQIVQQKPSVVIHTAGPFLDRRYQVAHACIEAGVHYIDLADNRDFVLNVHALNEAAQKQGVLVVSGASTVPAVSAAVVDHYRDAFSQIDSIDIGITPGSRAPRGRSTIESVLAYCGKPFTAWRDGNWQQVFGWQNLRRVQYPELGTRWFANCDVPDLQLFPTRYAVRRSVMFAAALELRIMQFSVWAMSWLTRCGIVNSWIPAAGVLKSASDPLSRFGSDRGGMHIHIKGVDVHDKPQVVEWFVIAGSGDGPTIPCIASIVLARKLARGHLSITGAMACVDLLTLGEFKAAVHGLDIHFVERTRPA